MIANFATGSGVTLPRARVVYGAYGRLNAARDNAVLLPSHYMANHHGHEWLIGPGLALDATRLFLTPGFGGDVERALRSIQVPVLYTPSETDLYFPITDAKYERQFMKTVQFAPIPSIWGHPAGAAANPEDKTFLNRTIAAFLAGKRAPP